MSFQYLPLYSAAQLIAEFGRHVGWERECWICGKHSLYAIRYPDDRGTVILCANCDGAHG